MAGKSAFKVEGIVTEALPNGTYRVELPNGHRVLAFVAGRSKQTFAGSDAGRQSELQMSPYDLVGRANCSRKERINLSYESPRISQESFAKTAGSSGAEASFV